MAEAMEQLKKEMDEFYKVLAGFNDTWCRRIDEEDAKKAQEDFKQFRLKCMNLMSMCLKNTQGSTDFSIDWKQSGKEIILGNKNTISIKEFLKFAELTRIGCDFSESKVKIWPRREETEATEKIGESDSDREEAETADDN